MPRNLIEFALTEREHTMILEALNMLYEDACEDANEGEPKRFRHWLTS